MSDSGIEQMYEDDLKAEAPKLGLYLDGKLRLTVYDTPSGRVRIEKAAMELRENEEGTVTVARVGVRVHDVVAVGQRSRERRTPSRVPEPCCTPRPLAKPSGIRLCHAWDCPKHPAQVFVSPMAATVRRPLNLAGKLQAETLRTGLELSAMRRHPAGGTLTAVDDHCPAHPAYSWWDCPEYDERPER